VVLTRRTAAFLAAAGLFPLLIWPNFLRIVATDERAFAPGPTAYLLVHAALGITSMALGLGLLVLAVRAWRRAPRAERAAAGALPGARSSAAGPPR
jgi:hypothetical protein